MTLLTNADRQVYGTYPDLAVEPCNNYATLFNHAWQEKGKNVEIPGISPLVGTRYVLGSTRNRLGGILESSEVLALNPIVPERLNILRQNEGKARIISLEEEKSNSYLSNLQAEFADVLAVIYAQKKNPDAQFDSYLVGDGAFFSMKPGADRAETLLAGKKNWRVEFHIEVFQNIWQKFTGEKLQADAPATTSFIRRMLGL